MKSQIKGSVFNQFFKISSFFTQLWSQRIEMWYANFLSKCELCVSRNFGKQNRSQSTEHKFLFKLNST